MKTITLLLVRLSPAARTPVLAAARLAWPAAEIAELGSVEEAADRRSRRPELLVVGAPDAAAAAAAIQAVAADGAPRWAVVFLGGDAADLAETIPAAEWQPPLLARVFRSAVQQHALLRENLRLQGDLKTVARRIRHDLGAPVGCIGTSSHVVRLSLSPAVLRPVAAMIRNIEESSAEISQIMDRVSFLLRASADPVAPAPVAMAGVVAGVLRELAPELRQAAAKVAQPDEWPEVSGVAAWLHVIWWNLLHNAVRHGGPAPEIRLEWSREGEECRLAVADRGAALDPVIAARLFRPFEQLHLLPAPGLGLSIVQRLVALQGGRCGYERRDDGASVFYFTVPAVPAGRGAGPRPRLGLRSSSGVEPVGRGG